MKTTTEIEAMVQVMPHVVKTYPFTKYLAVYSANAVNKETMFALVNETTMPVRLSLRCDPQLALLLREKYETVLPGNHLSKKRWNTIICSGQLGDEELRDLIRHSYELATVTQEKY